MKFAKIYVFLGLHQTYNSKKIYNFLSKEKPKKNVKIRKIKTLKTLKHFMV